MNAKFQNKQFNQKQCISCTVPIGVIIYLFKALYKIARYFEVRIVKKHLTS